MINDWLSAFAVKSSTSRSSCLSQKRNDVAIFWRGAYEGGFLEDQTHRVIPVDRTGVWAQMASGFPQKHSQLNLQTSRFPTSAQ